MSNFHQPVLLSEVIEAFHYFPLKIFVDGTVGAGGHAAAILSAHPEIEVFIGIDQDPEALSLAEERLKPWRNKVYLKQSNFSEFNEVLKEKGIHHISGIMVDLGVSSMQFDRPDRGFSFSKEGPLDMRMNPNNPLTAAEIVNHYSEKEIGIIFRDFGEESRWKIAAKRIVEKRKEKPIITTFDLVETLQPIFHWNRKKGINPLTLVFQALRIAVNDELAVLEDFLPRAIHSLDSKARLAVISFHSLEDRIAKRSFQFAASDKSETTGIGGLFRDKEPEVKIITKKPLEATEEEIIKNPRSRSAKLRVVEKI